MIQNITFETQKVVYNPETKIVKTAIDEPFLKAGKILGWPDHRTVGIGLNKSLIEFVEKTKTTLIVFVGSSGHDYFIKWDELKNFIKTHNTEYKVSGKYIHVIAWDIFRRSPYDR